MLEGQQNDNFERPPNIEIIRINSTRYVTKRSVADAIGPWLAEKGVTDEQFCLEGNQPNGKNFVVRFHLNPLSAARFVQDALSNLRDNDGNWKVINAKLVNGQNEKLHIGPDESPKTRCQRRMAKCIQKAMSALYPEVEDVHYRPYKTTVHAGQLGLCRVEPDKNNVERTCFLWNYSAISDLGINKTSLLDKIMQLLQRPEDNIEWSL